MRRALCSATTALLFAAIAALPASAQDTSHPAGIYAGTCPVPGNAVVTLWDVSPDFLVDGQANAGESVGSALGYPVEGSATVVEMAFADLVDSEHAILVHRSQGAMDDYLVCGDIDGVMNGDELDVALAPVGSSAWSGIATLEDLGDGNTDVTIHVFEGPGFDTGPGNATIDRSQGPAFGSDGASDRDNEEAGSDQGRKVEVCHFPGHRGDFVIGDDPAAATRCTQTLGGNVITVNDSAVDAHVSD